MKKYIVILVLVLAFNTYSAEREQSAGAAQEPFTQEYYQTYCAAREFLKLVFKVRQNMKEKNA